MSETYTVSKFKAELDKLAEDIGCDGKKIGSHNIKSSVTVECENSNDRFEITGLDISTLWGCGCWDGIVLCIKKIENEPKQIAEKHD